MFLLTIVILDKHSRVQWLFNFYCSAMVALYIAKVWPFKSKIKNLSEAINEFSLIVFSLLTLPLTTGFSDVKYRKIRSRVSWIIIGMFILVLLINVL